MTAESVDSVVYINTLKQVDNERFSVDWSDGRTSVFSLGFLQEHCPCALCKGQAVARGSSVSARRIVSVGRYALRVEFSSGCSNGIYDFGYLRKLDSLRSLSAAEERKSK